MLVQKVVSKFVNICLYCSHSSPQTPARTKADFYRKMTSFTATQQMTGLKTNTSMDITEHIIFDEVSFVHQFNLRKLAGDNTVIFN